MKNMKKIMEALARVLFLLCSVISVAALVMITVYILSKGLPAMSQIGFGDFLFGRIWQPGADVFGILPMMMGSIYVTLGAVLLGVPVGILCAVFMAEFAPRWMAGLMRPAVELLAAIPSVVFGFFGLMVFVPLLDGWSGGTGGNSMLAAIIILAIMILPTIITITEKALLSVPESYKEGSLGLGATHMQTVFRVSLPAAKSGVFSGVVLGIGRAIGETMAVILVAGNAPQIPIIRELSASGIFDFFMTRVRTLTANCALEMNYASGLHADALMATGVVLFVFIMILNIVLTIVQGRKEEGK